VIIMAFSCSCRIQCLYMIAYCLFLRAFLNQCAKWLIYIPKSSTDLLSEESSSIFYYTTWSSFVFLALSPSKDLCLLDKSPLAWFSSSIWFRYKSMKIEISFLRFYKFHYFSFHFSSLSWKLDSTHSTLCIFRSYCKVGRFYSPCLLAYVCLSLIKTVGIGSFKSSKLINFIIFISCSLEKINFAYSVVCFCYTSSIHVGFYFICFFSSR